MGVLFKKSGWPFVAAILLIAELHLAPARAQMGFEIKPIEIEAGQKTLLIDDVNHDGFQDLVIALEEDNALSVMLGDGKGGFADGRLHAAGENPASLASADFNGDGYLDLAIANHEKTYLTLLLGDGRGEFREAPAGTLPLTTSPHSHVVRAADMDGDGHMDLLVDSRDALGVYVLKGQGSNQFEAPGIGVDVSGRPYLGFAVADINGDGLLDLVTPNMNDVSVMLQSRGEMLQFDISQKITHPSPFAVALADMTGDGRIDLIASSLQEGMAIYPGKAAPGFDEESDAQFPIASGAKQLTVGDINGDGISDVVVNSWNADIRIVFGSKTSQQSQRLELGGIETPWGVAVGDLNGDGNDDIVVADGAKPAATIYFAPPSPK